MTETASPTQRIVKLRRDYNTWVADESLEDYALRFTPRAFRKWSEWRVANTAFGAASFLVLEAIGGAILVNYGFVNAFWAFMAIGLIIFLTGLPISYYAAKYGVDMDLLTRGAGFGYIGSTITSLIYASFTFILFALEGAIMAYALELALGIPPAIGYLISAMAVIPLVTHGITLISRFQAWTQPVWLLLLALPYIFVMAKDPGALSGLWMYAGNSGEAGVFNWFLFGSAVTVGLALITQIGEQVDYLRFMPEQNANNRLKWHVGVLVGGPGWIFMGIPKMLGGAFLAYLAIQAGVALDRVVDPNQMYLHGFNQVFTNLGLAAAVTAIFVVVSQLKINITNAYAGSLAWSNFFARLTHSHPGRVVWVIFNVLIALMLMEMNVFHVLEQVLGLYSNIAISWVVAVVADLVVNKPLGLSPKGIEFRRAYLYDINPVGVGATLIASVLSIAAFTGAMGETARGFSAFIAMLSAFVSAPLIAWLTQGKYYLVRPTERGDSGARARTCSICEKTYESDDMAHCPAYQGYICSLCCSLDARCHDMCRPRARLSAQWVSALQKMLPRSLWHHVSSGLGHYLLLFSGMLVFLAALLSLLYYHEAISLGTEGASMLPQMRLAFLKIFAVMVLVSGITSWWFVLTSESRRVAQKESNQQTGLLMREIDAHRITDTQLQKAKHAAESANQAKSRYVSAISHEIRTPLNSILGYSQILDADESIPVHRRQAIGVIRRSGEHLLSLIEGVLDIARIESGKLKLDIEELHFIDFMQQVVRMFELQARNKGIEFHYEPALDLPVVVRADKKRLGQILINILGNAVKFTERGSVHLRVKYAREMAQFEIEDTGPGIPPEELDRVFEPFVRGSAAAGMQAGGTGLGLTIGKMLVDLMGGELFVRSTPATGTVFQIRLFLPHVHNPERAFERPVVMRTGYKGPRCRILIVDNEAVDREMLANVLEPLGFEVRQAASGFACLGVLDSFQPDLILMDLAMPGIDGWETIRRMRQLRLSTARIAIVSANAFDKGLENDVGVPPEDFILKPLNVSELLDWIGRNFALEWETQVPSQLPETAPTADEKALVYPPAEFVHALNDLVTMGYVRGILKKLDEIEALDARFGFFVQKLRPLARQFRFDAIAGILQQSESHDDSHARQEYD